MTVVLWKNNRRFSLSPLSISPLCSPVCVYVLVFGFFILPVFPYSCPNSCFFVVRAYMFFFSAVFYKSGLYGRVKRRGSRGKNTSDFPSTQESQMHRQTDGISPGWNETLNGFG